MLRHSAKPSAIPHHPGVLIRQIRTTKDQQPDLGSICCSGTGCLGGLVGDLQSTLGRQILAPLALIRCLHVPRCQATEYLLQLLNAQGALKVQETYGTFMPHCNASMLPPHVINAHAAEHWAVSRHACICPCRHSNTGSRSAFSAAPGTKSYAPCLLLHAKLP